MGIGISTFLITVPFILLFQFPKKRKQLIYDPHKAFSLRVALFVSKGILLSLLETVKSQRILCPRGDEE
jgi:hypothetical protein